MALRASLREAAFHDVAAQIETVFEWTDTRLVAYYRMNSLQRPRLPSGGPVRATRFDVRISARASRSSGALTRADWDVLFAFRNLFYEPTEGGFLDEVSVVNPPKRVIGGYLGPVLGPGGKSPTSEQGFTRGERWRGSSASLLFWPAQ